MLDDTRCLLCDWTGPYESYAAHRNEARGGPIPAPEGMRGVILLAVRGGEVRFTASGSITRIQAVAILSEVGARLCFPEDDAPPTFSVEMEVDDEPPTPPAEEAPGDA